MTVNEARARAWIERAFRKTLGQLYDPASPSLRMFEDACASALLDAVRTKGKMDAQYASVEAAENLMPRHIVDRIHRSAFSHAADVPEPPQ